MQDALRQLREQQSSTFQAVELIRGHTEAALQSNAIAVSNQLAQLSEAIAGHSDRQFQLMRSVESRTLRGTLLILVIVALAAAGFLLFVARALRVLTHPQAIRPPGLAAEELPDHAAAGAGSLLDHAAGSAYATALLEVEKRIAALEHRQPPTSAPADVAGPQAQPHQRPVPAAPARPRPAASVALTVGSGEALVFLPRDTSPGAGGRIASALGRIGRMFRRN